MENRFMKTTEYCLHTFIMFGAILLAWYDRSKMHFIIPGVKIKVPCPVMCTFHLVLICIHAQYWKRSAILLILLTVNIVGVINITVLLHIWVNGLSYETRMHSSRMRITHSLTVSHCILCMPPQKKPCSPPRKNHACPPETITHPPEKTTCPPWSNHACNPKQPCTPPC